MTSLTQEKKVKHESGEVKNVNRERENGTMVTKVALAMLEFWKSKILKLLTLESPYQN